MNKWLILIICTTIVALMIFLGSLGFTKRLTGNLISPIFFNTKGIEIEITPTPAPKTFQFDSSTNLNQELDSVNPEVKDDDFEKLQQIIESI